MKPVTLKQKLINKLAKREHTAYELIEWCAARGFDRSEASASVLALKEAGLQSDQRFCDMWVRHRQTQGYGQYRIIQELISKGVTQECIDAADVEWCDPMSTITALAQKHRHKGQDRLKRWLYQRGFAIKDIERAVGMDYISTSE